MLKNNRSKVSLALFLCCFMLPSCYKDLTHFYEDPQTPGLSIFSDKANNIMTCYIDGQLWRTYDRRTAGFSTPPFYEVFVTKIAGTATEDTLMINWLGRGNNNFYELILKLSMPKNFTSKDFNSLQGKRLHIDTTNGYFTNSEYYQTANLVGTGNIYFHLAELNSIGLNSYQGRMSGLFDADFGAIKIGNGRFDHEIDSSQVNF